MNWILLFYDNFKNREMGQLFSFSLPIVHSWPAAESSKLATTSKTSPSSNLCEYSAHLLPRLIFLGSERRGSNKRLAELDEFDAKFHPLCRHFGRFRTGRADDELSSADQVFKTFETLSNSIAFRLWDFTLLISFALTSPERIKIIKKKTPSFNFLAFLTEFLSI